MKNYLPKAALLITIILLSSWTFVAPSARELVNQMLETGKKVQTLKFTLVKQERINGKMVVSKDQVKMQQRPFKVYLKQESPATGLEVLYVQGQNSNEAWVRPSSFPWTTISLNPYGNTMRSGQHHTLLDIGFNQILNLTDFTLEKYGELANSMLKLNGTTTWNNQPCYQLTLDNPYFKWIDYTAGKNETVLSLANRLRVSEYQILERNNLSDYGALKPGQRLKIPTDYATRIVLLMDQKTNLPVLIKVYDDKGLFEQFEYHNLQVNPGFREGEFTQEYKDYKF